MASTDNSAIDPPTLTGFDPLSQEFMADPAPILARAQTEQPVFFYPPLNYWVVTGFGAVERVVSDYKTFSSSAVDVLPVPNDLKHRVPPDFYDRSFLASDPPVHTVSRKAANQAFKRSQIAEMGADVEEIANLLIERFIDKGHCDLMEDYAYPLSIRTLSRLIGLPEDDENLESYQGWAPDLVAVLTPKFPPAPNGDQAPQTPMDPAELRERYERIAAARDFFEQLIDERERNPQNDLLSLMLHARAGDGERALPRAVVVTHMIELITAGSSTTANLIGHILKFLAAAPGQLEQVAANPELIENSIEETLRYRPSTFGVFRLATTDVEIEGITIPKGALIWASYASTGHDEERFDSPEAFDVHRTNSGDHLNFGKGRHFCMGESLARLETDTAIRTLLQRIPSISIPADQATAYAPSLIVPELLHLKAEWPQAS